MYFTSAISPKIAIMAHLRDRAAKKSRTQREFRRPSLKLRQRRLRLRRCNLFFLVSNNAVKNAHYAIRFFNTHHPIAEPRTRHHNAKHLWD